MSSIVGEPISSHYGSFLLFTDINPNVIKSASRSGSGKIIPHRMERVVAESDREEINEKLSEHYLEKFEKK